MAGGIVATIFISTSDNPRPTLGSRPAQADRFGEPIAAVSYRNDQGGATIVTLDAEANVRVCLRGSRNIEVADVARGSILFLNTDLFVVPLSCAGHPRRVAALAELAGPDRSGDPHLTCARFSSDARRVTVNVVQRTSSATQCQWASQSQIWVGGADGSAWRRIGPGTGRGWIDDRHVLVEGIGDAHAMNVETGRVAFLEVPHLWLGARSADGTKVVYDEHGGAVFRTAQTRPGDVVRRPDGKSVTLLVDREKSVTRPVTLPRSSHRVWIKMASLWSPDGRFVTDDVAQYERRWSGGGGADSLQPVRIHVHGADMTRLREFPLESDVAPHDVRIAWFDARRIFIGSRRGLALADVETGERRRVDLPGLKRESILVGSAMIIFSDSQREGIAAAEPSLVTPDRLGEFRDNASRISFRVPPSWRVQRCRCAGGRSDHGWVAFGRSEVRSEIRFYGVTFTTSGSSVAATRRRLIRSFRAGSDDEIRVFTSRRTLGGVSFEVLHIAENERGFTVLIGRAAGRTFVFEVGGPPDDDPSLEVILQTIRFG